MRRPIAEIEAEIRDLSAADEDRLDTLLAELDGPADPDVDRLWLEEAQRGGAELDAGLVKPIPAEEVFERLLGRHKP